MEPKGDGDGRDRRQYGRGPKTAARSGVPRHESGWGRRDEPLGREWHRAARTCCLGQGEAVTEADWSATRNAEATRSAKMGNYSADGGLM